MVETRSKTGEAKEGMVVDVFSDSTSEENDRMPTNGRTLEQKLRLGYGGRKIKQEVLDLSTQQSIVTDTQKKSTKITAEEETDREIEVVEPKYNTTEKVPPNKLLRKSLSRTVKSRKVGTGKRRLQGSRGQKVTKKYFKDIREYAKALPLNKPGKNSISQQTPSQKQNSNTLVEADDNGLLIATIQKDGQNVPNDEDAIDRIEQSTDSTDSSGDTDMEENTLPYDSEEIETEESHSSGNDLDSSASSGIDYEEMLRSYSTKHDGKTPAELDREDERRFKQKLLTEIEPESWDTEHGSNHNIPGSQISSTEDSSIDIDRKKTKEYGHKYKRSPEQNTNLLEAETSGIKKATYGYPPEQENAPGHYKPSTEQTKSGEKGKFLQQSLLNENVSEEVNEQASKNKIPVQNILLPETDSNTKKTDNRYSVLVDKMVDSERTKNTNEGSNNQDDVVMSDTDSTAVTMSNTILEESGITNISVTRQNKQTENTELSTKSNYVRTEKATTAPLGKRKVSFKDTIQFSETTPNAETNRSVNTDFNSEGLVPIEDVVGNSRYNKQTYSPEFKLIAKARTNEHQTMKERGYTMVENKVVLETPVKVEFNVDKSVREYNVREKVLELLDLMKTVDPTMKVKSTITDHTEWDALNTLPEDEEFGSHFQVRDFTYRKTRKVLVHLRLSTKFPINRIKYSPKVKEFIFHNNVWLKTDWFNTRIESSPGIITMVHPKIINRDRYKEELLIALQTASSNLVLDTGNESGDKQSTPNPRKSPPTIPTFYLESSTKKWGDISTEVLRLNCAKEDSENLKFLLSSASEQGLITRGSFVPAGLHLMEGKSIVTNILKAHENFLRETTGIPLTGLTLTDMQREVASNTTVKQMIEHLEGVESVEQFRANRYQGQWTIITKRTNQTDVIKEIGTKLSSLYRTQEGQTKFITVGNTRLHNKGTHTNTVATYAEILSRKYGPSKVATHSKNSGDTLSDAPAASLQATVSTESEKSSKTTSVFTEEERQKPSKKTDPYKQDSKLLRKLKQIEEVQAQLIKTQQEMTKAHNETQQLTEENLAEQENKQKQIEEMIDTKLQEFTIDQTRLVKETHAAFHKETDRLVGDKINTISVTVGNQVAAQLIQVFKQYLPHTERIDSRPAEIVHNPMITQEANHSQMTQRPLETPQSTIKKSYEHSDMLQELQAIEKKVALKSSPHDKTLEQAVSK